MFVLSGITSDGKIIFQIGPVQFRRAYSIQTNNLIFPLYTVLVCRWREVRRNSLGRTQKPPKSLLQDFNHAAGYFLQRNFSFLKTLDLSKVIHDDVINSERRVGKMAQRKIALLYANTVVWRWLRVSEDHTSVYVCTSAANSFTWVAVFTVACQKLKLGEHLIKMSGRRPTFSLTIVGRSMIRTIMMTTMTLLGEFEFNGKLKPAGLASLWKAAQQLLVGK